MMVLTPAQIARYNAPIQWQVFAEGLEQGQTIQVPMQPAQVTSLRELLAQHPPRATRAALPSLQLLTFGGLTVDEPTRTDLETRRLALPGLALGQDTLKGAAVGGAVAGVLLSLTETAKHIGNPLLFALSLIGLGAVVWPELIDKVRKCDVDVKVGEVSLKLAQPSR